MSKNLSVEKWYLDELKRKVRPTFLQRIGMTQRFLRRKKKTHFSIINFFKYITRKR